MRYIDSTRVTKEQNVIGDATLNIHVVAVISAG